MRGDVTVKDWVLAKLRAMPAILGFSDILIFIGLVFLFVGSWRLSPAWAYLLVGGLVFCLGLVGSIFGVKRK